MDDPENKVHEELTAVVTILEDFLGRSSRWNGEVELSHDPLLRGRVSWRGSISLRADLASDPVRWRTLIHETLHTFSVGLTPSDYAELRGWEEGVVEQLQRLLRPVVLDRLGLTADEDIFAAVEVDHPFNSFIEVLEHLHDFLEIAATDFYLDLLKVPLRERPGYIRALGDHLTGIKLAEYRRLFAVSFSQLRGGISHGRLSDEAATTLDDH